MIKIIAIDYGLKKTGVAFFDGNLVQPIDVIRIKDQQKLLVKISQYVLKYQPQLIVMGLPESGELLSVIKKFALQLETFIGIKVTLFEETLTTQEAIVRMNLLGKTQSQKKKKEDAFAAALLLEDYLELNNLH